MYCGKCGEKNNDDDFFCTKCGNKLNNDNNINNDSITDLKENTELSKEKAHEDISTVWLDFISTLWGISGIFFILTGFIDLFNGDILVFSNNLIKIISGIIYTSALYFIHTRSKLGYYLYIYILTILSVNTLFNGIIAQHDNEYLISYIIGAIIGILLNYIPNIIYIKKRKFLFLNEEENYYGTNIFYFILLFSLFISCTIFLFNIGNI